jgi:pimeloyl-ACP methyl ester carboxylesterase
LPSGRRQRFNRRPKKKIKMTDGLWQNGYHAINGVRLFCRDWRPGGETGLPVLALHGSLTQSGMWFETAETLGSVRMLCPDQRGYALTQDTGDDACVTFASDAVALVRALLPGRYVVMGHSFAASIALETALLTPEQVAGVVLVDPVVRLAAPPTAPAGNPVSQPEGFTTLDDAARYIRDTEEGVWTDATSRRFVQDIMTRDGDGGLWRFPYTAARLRRLRAFQASAAGDYELFAKAKAVRCPALIFRGGMSKRFSAAAEQPFLDAFVSASGSPKPECVLCPASGHFPTTTEPGIVVAALKRFLGSIA